MKIVSLALLFLVTCIVPSLADGLTFEKVEEKIDAAADAKEVTVKFPFKNSSSKTVKIMRYDAPCTCMFAELKGGKRSSKNGPVSFAPGEEGVLEGRFELGNFKGTVEKKIVVWLEGDSEDKPSIMLNTQVTIPYLIAAFPQSLAWELGAKPETKVIEIKVDHDQPINITKHTCSNPQIEYAFETVREGYEYKVSVTPKSTKKVVFAALRFTTDSKNPRYKMIQTFMTVKPKKK